MCKERKQIMSTSLDSIRYLHLHDTLHPDFPAKFFGLDENHNIFPGKLFKGNFMTFLVLVNLGFS